MARNGWILVAISSVALAWPGSALAETVSGTVPAEAAGGPIAVRVLDADTAELVATHEPAEPGPYSLTVPAGLYILYVTAGEHFASHSRIFRLATDGSATPEMIVDKAEAPPAAQPQEPAPTTAPPPAPTTAPLAPQTPAKPAARKRKKCKKPPPRCKKRRYARTKTCRRAKSKYTRCRKAQRKPTARRSALARPAIGVVEWTVDVDGYGPVKLWHSMITSVAQSCMQDEMDHVAAAASDLAILDAEIAFQQSEYVDPSTRADPSKRIHATHHVTGEGQFDAQGNGTLTIHVRAADGTPVTSVTVTGSIFDVTDAAAKQLGDLLCRKLRVQFSGERHNRTDVYACPPPNQDWFHHYDGTFEYDTPADKRFVFPKGAGWTNLTGTVSWTDSGNDGTEQGSEPTGDYLDVNPAGDGRMQFSLNGLSFNPALKKAGFTASWGELVAGVTTWPVDISWDRHGTDNAGCTYDDDGTITGTFTVTPEAPALRLG